MLPARLSAPGYEQTADHIARLARLTLDGDGAGEAAAVASVPVPGGVVEILGGPGLDREAAAAKLRAQLTETDAELDPRPRQARQRRALSPKRRRTSCRPSATSVTAWSRRASDCSRSCASSTRTAAHEPDERRGGRALPVVVGAVRDAIRSGPDAPDDDRAGPARAPLRLDPRDRHQRQVVDDPDDRRDPVVAHGCGPAPTCRRICSRSPSASGSIATTSQSPSSAPRSAARAVPRCSSIAAQSQVTRSRSSRR